MKTRLWILPFSIVLLLGAAPDEPNVDHYKEGQRLFGERNFAAALGEFETVDARVPKEPQVYSWIGACLNELGRYAEAEERLKAAFELLREEQRQAAEKNRPVPPIDIGYHTLLARIQVNLRAYDRAVETIESYSIEDDGSEQAAKAKQARDAARQGVKAKLVAVGAECLRSSDLDGARAAFAQAERLDPATPSVWESVARESLSRAERAPGATEEDKAKKAELHAAAVQAGRLWLEVAGDGSTDAPRVLAKALSGTKTREGYEEAIRILTALWSADPRQADGSIQLDLAVAHAGLEQWDLAVASASTFIELNPNDPLGQGYCLRSFGQFQMGRCQEAIDDGRHCKSGDGTPRPLSHLDACRQRLARQEADKAAAKQAKLERQCRHLYDKIRWASSPLTEIPLADLLEVVADFKAGEAECTPYLEAATREDSQDGFDSPMPALCAAGAKTASFPLNLSTRSRDELEALRAATQEFLRVCRPFLDATQTQGVEGGLLKVERALD
jgi:tetratricopeptide (TPR) repeat protein